MIMLKNKIVFLMLISSLLFALAPKAFAENKPQVLIINQVRGEECCDKGNIDNLKKQIEVSTKLEIPAYFAVRYDALNDPKYINYLKEKIHQFPQIINLGILIEITPKLASDAEVKYKGNNDNWFGAQNIFSVGYTLEENKKITDFLFSKFNQEFGFYPKLTSSWMINTNLLNYIHDKYDVLIHQITREQWGTDSYTLDGGPPHYPYPASSNWLFVPDYKKANSPIIVRQTVSDPLFNYGDKTSSYTSQPNDYLKNKNFSYFISLLDQALFEQKNTGFVLLGLENSMGSQFQDEYIKQLELLNSYKKRSLILFPSINDIQSFWSKNKITLYGGKDIVGGKPNYAYWINTLSYRIRLRIQDEKVFISDIRIYNTNFTDPYDNNLAFREGYWINPFLINGAINQKSNDDNISLFDKPMPTNNFIEIKNDNKNYGNKILLPNITKNLNITKNDNQLNISYESRSRKIKISFQENKIITNGINSDDYIYKNSTLPFYPIEYKKQENGFSLQWKTKNTELIGLNTKCNKLICNITINSDAKILENTRKIDYEYLLPDPANHNLDSKKTVFYANNKYTIAGRNPVRIVVIPYDKYGIVTTFSKNTKITSESNLKTEKFSNDKRLFFDFYSSDPISENIILNFGSESKTTKVYFAPNCKNNLSFCIKNPKYLWWYTNAIFGDKIRQILYKEK